MNLKKRLVLIIGATVVVALLVSFVAAYVLLRSVAERYVEARLRFIADQLTRNLSLPLLLEDRKLGEKLLRTALREPEIRGLEVLRQGRVWIAVGRTKGRRFLRREIRVLAPEEEALFPSSSQILGQVRIYYGGHLPEHTARDFFLIFAVMALVVALLSATVVYLAIYRAVALPLVELTQAVRRVSAGNLDLRVSGKGLPETEELAEAFNTMLQSLKAHQEKLRQVYRDLAEQRFLAEVGKFSAMVAHEIKNPLGILKGSVDLLKKKELPPEEKEKLLLFIEEEIKRLDNLIKNFLLYARPVKPNMRTVHLEVIMEIIKQKMDLYFQGKALEISAQIKRPTVDTDPDLIMHALHNLVKNAYEAGADWVRLTVVSEEDRLVFRVCDNGPGIDPGVRAKIFEPFYTTKSKGSGLGLSVVRKIVEALGGRVEVGECAEGGGAEFVIVFALEDQRR